MSFSWLPLSGPTILRQRAESYSSDAGVLRAQGDTDAAVIYETVAKELRETAAALEDVAS